MKTEQHFKQVFSRFLWLHNVRVFSPIYKSLVDRTLLGFNLASPSVIRKSTTLELIKNFILDHKLPYQVEDSSPETSHFTIKITQ